MIGFIIKKIIGSKNDREVKRLRPHAIVLDLGLPFRSGAALLVDLKADPRTAAVPVLVVSALLETLPPDRAALAAALLAKPFEVPDLLALLHRTLGPQAA